MDPEEISSIGMFDSGIGGLTVMKQVMRILPQENVIYLGDTARLPYGEKSQETVIRYSIENAIFLLEKKIKLLILACNTASAYAVDKLQQIFSIPIIGVIHPGADKAIQSTRSGHIAVLGTKGTIRSQAYQKAILKLMPKATVYSIACPLLVPLVEEHFSNHPAAKIIVREYLKSLKNTLVDTILLGCTHYPLLKNLIQEEVGDAITIVDSAETCAENIAFTLERNQLRKSTFSPPSYKFFVSDDPQKFQLAGEAFLGMPIEKIELTKSWF